MLLRGQAAKQDAVRLYPNQHLIISAPSVKMWGIVVIVIHSYGNALELADNWHGGSCIKHGVNSSFAITKTSVAISPAR